MSANGDAERDRAMAGDAGSASLQIVLLTPLFLAIALFAFQAAMWSHQRTVARAIARDAVTLVAQGGQSAADTEDNVRAVLAIDGVLSDPHVRIRFHPGDSTTRAGATTVAATVTGRAPGLIIGTSVEVAVTEVLPLEGWQPSGPVGAP